MSTLASTANKRESVGIAGGGALGTLFAFGLAGANNVAVLVRRKDVAEAISRAGVRVDEQPSRRVDVGTDPALLRDAATVFVATKAYDLESALESASEFINGDATIVSLSNGLDNVQRIERVLGARQSIVAAPTSEAVRLIEAGAVARNGLGTTVLGAGNSSGASRVKAVATLLRDAGFMVDVREPIDPWVWAKAIGNVAINPVGALFDLENGAIMEHERARSEAFALAREAAAVARAQGVVLPFEDPAEYVRRLAEATRHNRSSMWHDVQRGGLTEIDWLNGAICERGARLGVPTPRNCAVRDEVNRRGAPYGSGHG